MATAYQVIKGILVTVASLAVWYFISTHLKFELDVITELPSSISEIEYLRKELRYWFLIRNISPIIFVEFKQKMSRVLQILRRLERKGLCTKR
jgi:hypothetical protein